MKNLNHPCDSGGPASYLPHVHRAIGASGASTTGGRRSPCVASWGGVCSPPWPWRRSRCSARVAPAQAEVSRAAIPGRRPVRRGRVPSHGGDVEWNQPERAASLAGRASTARMSPGPARPSGTAGGAVVTGAWRASSPARRSPSPSPSCRQPDRGRLLGGPCGKPRGPHDPGAGASEQPTAVSPPVLPPLPQQPPIDDHPDGDVRRRQRYGLRHTVQRDAEHLQGLSFHQRCQVGLAVGRRACALPGSKPAQPAPGIGLPDVHTIAAGERAVKHSPIDQRSSGALVPPIEIPYLPGLASRFKQHFALLRDRVLAARCGET